MCMRRKTRSNIGSVQRDPNAPSRGCRGRKRPLDVRTMHRPQTTRRARKDQPGAVMMVAGRRRQRRDSSRRGVADAHLHARLALIAVDRDVARDMNAAAAALEQEIAERLADAAEADRVDELAAA